MTEAQSHPLLFTPLSSSLSPAFWHSLTELKLHILKLSQDPLPIHSTLSGGKYIIDRSSKEGHKVGIDAAVECGEGSLTEGESTKEGVVSMRGTLYNYNTIEDFKKSDKTALLSSLADSIWETINHPTGKVINPQDLNPFLLITFADLKKYRYYYWFAFPALLQKPSWEYLGHWKEEDELGKEVRGARQAVKGMGGWALGKVVQGENVYGRFEDCATFFDGVPDEERSLVFQDPSSQADSPSWILRNVLYYLSHSHSITTLRILSLQESTSRSVIIRLKSETGAIAVAGKGERPGVVGWEKNEKGKLGPRLADLAPLMDPTRLADQAVELNLQLMKWRIMPNLDLEKVKQTKCLLLGAGTLGCYVARTLLAWGVKKITFVDSSTVSFSNPVRQPLFEFEDSLGGGKMKAQAAADSLKRIYPGVESEGITMSIPMPGHPIAPTLVEKTREDVKRLERLIEEHDVVYLLMDSRESRWLPTVIGASKKKLVMNVALGFDTYLVMRHGVPKDGEEASSPMVKPGATYEGRLGCYYCNDIVAPADSLTDRTLDQMCTVTRPGIASIASSTAVELMVSVLQHSKGVYAPSDIPIISNSTSSESKPKEQEPEADTTKSSPLGIVPHQIRGFLSQFHNLKITGQAYNLCTGCSPKIVKAYEEGGWEMISQAFEDAKYLERVTGLDKLFEESEAAMEGVDWVEEDDEEDEGDF